MRKTDEEPSSRTKQRYLKDDRVHSEDEFPLSDPSSWIWNDCQAAHALSLEVGIQEPPKYFPFNESGIAIQKWPLKMEMLFQGNLREDCGYKRSKVGGFSSSETFEDMEDDHCFKRYWKSFCKKNTQTSTVGSHNYPVDCKRNKISPFATTYRALFSMSF